MHLQGIVECCIYRESSSAAFTGNRRVLHLQAIIKYSLSRQSLIGALATYLPVECPMEIMTAHDWT
jgi:hypothetical protein